MLILNEKTTVCKVYMKDAFGGKTKRVVNRKPC